jgi:hypothetical protein
MKKSCVEILIASVCLVSCRDNDPQNVRNVEETLDASSFYNYSKEDLRLLQRSANEGDIDSGRKLSGYYATHNQANQAKVWDDWLVARGDFSTSLERSENLFRRARKLHDRDPRKEKLLAESLRLSQNARLTQSPQGSESAQIDVSLKKARAEYETKLKAEIERLKAVRE